MRCWFYVRPHVLKPHFENCSCHVKSRGQRAVKMGSSWEPFSEPRDRGAVLTPPGPQEVLARLCCLQPGRMDDSHSRNSSLYLKVQPRRGNSLASGILLGHIRDPDSLPVLGGEGMLLFLHKATDVSISWGCCVFCWRLKILSENKVSLFWVCRLREKDLWIRMDLRVELQRLAFLVDFFFFSNLFFIYLFFIEA